MDHSGLPARSAVRGTDGQGLRPVRRRAGAARHRKDDVIRVEGRLTENDPAKLKFGQDVELTMIPFTTDEDGNEVVTFAFQPV